MTPEEMEQLLRKEAEELVKTEPLSKLMLEEQVLNRKNFADMLCVTLACQLAGEVIDRAELEKIFNEIYQKYPNLLICAAKDLKATAFCCESFIWLSCVENSRKAKLIAECLYAKTRKTRFACGCITVLTARNAGLVLSSCATWIARQLHRNFR